MKKLTTILFAAALLPLGCGQSAEASNARDKATEALDAIGTYTQKQLDELGTTLKGGWADLQDETAKLEEAAKARGGELKASLGQAIADAKEKAAAAKLKLADASTAGGENASEAMGHAKRALDEAKTSLAKAWEELRKK